ncbi:MAG TPA: aromatic ring-hydroxylating dioxygenase subunit alpha, partial [Dehalococcoidia bacterium]|nr:aromatic ring-hydroxylating dioxygenase subunit alpha [Dehalococcoidia bacterium]
MVLYTSGPSVGTEPYIEETDEDFRVSPRIFTDPAIFEEEMERIFGRAWVYVGHVSEIAQAGDYKTSSIGRTPIILSRDQHGQIHVLVNACRHRANAVCRSDAGNSTYFRCPYHGWVYANDGRLIGVAMRKGYPPSFGEDVDGLVRAARVAVYRGLIFASMAPAGPTIEEYLGPVARHIDAWADQAIEGDLEVVRPHQYNYFGNWKFQAENGADGYHPGFVHESAFKTFSKF